MSETARPEEAAPDPRRRAALAALSLAGAGALIATRARAELPKAAVLRMSRGRFDPARYAEVDAMIRATGDYLIPAIRALPGLIAYYAATSPEGVTTQVSIWTSDAAGRQMSSLPEMRDRARAEAEAFGVVFEPIIQFPIDWFIPSAA